MIPVRSHRIRRHGDAEAGESQHTPLVRGVEAFHVGGRVGFGVTEALCLRESASVYAVPPSAIALKG